jgi:Bacterial Ig-like domain (group 2)
VPPGAPSIASVEVTPTRVSLTVGDAQLLAAIARDASGAVLARTIVWSTSSSAIVAITSDGRVTAVSPGEATITASSDGKSAVAVVSVSAAATAGVVSGRVTDTRGRPIAGAKIVINNALWLARTIVLRSGADGSYRFVLPPTDAWYVRGTTDVAYNGRTYTIELKPDFSASFPGTEGHVVNLQWTMTGEVPSDFGGGGFYGGDVQMDAGPGMFLLEGVTLTLTPVGALLDGSAGKVITHTVSERVGFIRLRDVPMGRYTIRATLNGAPLLIRKRYTTAFAANVDADFEPVYEGATVYGLYFAVTAEENVP